MSASPSFSLNEPTLPSLVLLPLWDGCWLHHKSWEAEAPTPPTPQQGPDPGLTRVPDGPPAACFAPSLFRGIRSPPVGPSCKTPTPPPTNTVVLDSGDVRRDSNSYDSVMRRHICIKCKHTPTKCRVVS